MMGLSELPLFTVICPEAVMLLPLKLPLASRFTIAFAVLLEVGATVQFSPNVPLLFTGEPLTVKSDGGALSPTVLTVPEPAKLQAQPEPFQAST